MPLNVKTMNRLLTLLLMIWMAAFATAADIVVDPGGSLHEALRQAREWRRTGDARCIGGINIIVKPGRYYMSEPLFLRPEDSGTASSPLTIRRPASAAYAAVASRGNGADHWLRR